MIIMKKASKFICMILLLVLLSSFASNSSAVAASAEPENTAVSEDIPVDETKEYSNTSLQEGLCYFYGINDHTYNKVAAQECFQEAAEAGVGEAYYYLGRLALRSNNDTRFEAAMDFYEKAIELGCDLGLLGKGELYEYGCGVTQNGNKAGKLYEEALANGCTEANFNLANMYSSAHDVDRDCVLALDYYTKALESKEFGYAATAPVRIGDLYMNGIGGIHTDYAAAIDWYQKGIDKGSSEGVVAMGLMYQYGFGVERDFQNAMEHFEKAVDMGSSSAMNNIGIMYNSGMGVKQNIETAERWYEKAVREGNSDAFYNLGNIYRNRDGNFEKAMDYYQKAINAGNPAAYTCIGFSCYMQNDAASELKWYEKGAALGNSLCMYNLGYLNEYGEGVPVDKNKALEWYEKSAEAGYPAAMLKVAGYRYGENGNNYKIDKVKAWRLFSDAAIHGEAGAMGAIAEYYNGHLYSDEKTEDDPELVLTWCGRALAINPNLEKYVNDIVNQLIYRGKTDREKANGILQYQKDHFILP